MKTKLQTLLLLVAWGIHAADIPLTWDPSPSDGVTNYWIYASPEPFTNSNRTNAPVRVPVGTNTVATLEEVQAGKIYIAASAENSFGMESYLSNMIVLEVPAAPGDMRTVILQESATLKVWSDVLFLRLKVPDPQFNQPPLPESVKPK